MHSLREIMASGLLMLKEFSQPERIVGKNIPGYFFSECRRKLRFLKLGKLVIIKCRSLECAFQRCN